MAAGQNHAAACECGKRKATRGLAGREVEDQCQSRGGFWSNNVDAASRSDVQVPGQADMQGIAIPRNHSYAYKTRIDVPVDFIGKRVFLRFEGVTGTAQAWVNGIAVGAYYGGFTVWDCGITDTVAAGKDAWLTVSEPQVSKTQARVRVESDGSDAVRMQVAGDGLGSDVRLFIDNLLNYRQLGLGNYMKDPVLVRAGYTGTVRMRIANRTLWGR
jgi:Glycosyl hydrolases family 2, sugar binding domain